MQQARDCQRLFQNDWRYLDPGIPLLVVADINAPIVRQRLAEIGPDVVLDHGTGIVRDELIDSVPLGAEYSLGLVSLLSRYALHGMGID